MQSTREIGSSSTGASSSGDTGVSAAVRNAGPIRRAHPRFVENLRSLGAQIEWDETQD